MTDPPAQAIARAFAHDDEGWPVSSLRAWLITEGRLITEPDALLGALAGQMEAARRAGATDAPWAAHAAPGAPRARLHVGTVIYGNVGAPDRLDFTVMGPAVNRCARLESLTKELLEGRSGLPVLMSGEFAGHDGRPVRSLGHRAMKGVDRPPEVFALPDDGA